MKTYRQNKFLYLNLTFMLIVVILSLALTACGKKDSNEVTNSTTTTEDNKKETEAEDTSLVDDSIYKYYYGEDDKYNISVIISKFTDKDLEDVKEQFGEKSDEYLRFHDDMPEYKVKMNLKYVGDGVDDFQDVDELNLNVKNSVTSDFDISIKGNQDITKVLTGVSPFYEDYLYNDSSRNSISKDSKDFNISGKFNNENLNFNINLEEKQWQ